MSEKLFLSNEQLKAYGCETCIWKAKSSCIHPELSNIPICDDYLNFLLDFAGDSDSVAIMRENFTLFVAELQHLEDYKHLKILEEEIRVLESMGVDNEKLGKLEGKRAMLKLWWFKLNEIVKKGYAQINDRSAKTDVTDVPRLTVQQLNIMIDDSARKLLEHEAKSKERENNQ